MRFLLWLGSICGAIWWGQHRGWIQGTPGAALVLAVAVWFALPFVRSYVKLYNMASARKVPVPGPRVER